MAITEYAYTERYVRPGGAGANDGTSWADAWDITQVAADLAAGKRFNISDDGTGYTLTASLAWSTAGSLAAPICFIGWNSSRTAYAASFSENPVLTFGASFALSPIHHQMYNRLRLTGGSHGIRGDFTGADNLLIHKCEVDNVANTGIATDRYSVVSQCRTRDSVTGIQMAFGGEAYLNESYDNTTGIYHSSFSGTSVGNFVARNSTYGIRHVTNGGNLIASNTIDDCGQAIAGTGDASIIGNLITNCTSVDTSTYPSQYTSNNLYNNTTDPTGVRLDDGNTYLDPQYVDVANNDYEIQNASLIGVSVPLLGDVNIGAWQKSDTGGGGGGTTSVFGSIR